MLDVRYGRRFLKDLASIRGSEVFSQINRLCFEEIPGTKSLSTIAGIKKLVGFTNFYRIRVGDYRIGISLDDSAITFLRVLHRKDIYRQFP